MQLHLDMMGKYSNVGVDTFDTFIWVWATLKILLKTYNKDNLAITIIAWLETDELNIIRNMKILISHNY